MSRADTEKDILRGSPEEQQLDQIDFEQVAPAADESRVDLAPGSPPYNAFVRGLKKAAAYWFGYLPQSAER